MKKSVLTDIIKLFSVTDGAGVQIDHAIFDCQNESSPIVEFRSPEGIMGRIKCKNGTKIFNSGFYVIINASNIVKKIAIMKEDLNVNIDKQENVLSVKDDKYSFDAIIGDDQYFTTPVGKGKQSKRFGFNREVLFQNEFIISDDFKRELLTMINVVAKATHVAFLKRNSSLAFGMILDNTIDMELTSAYAISKPSSYDTLFVSMPIIKSIFKANSSYNNFKLKIANDGLVGYIFEYDDYEVEYYTNTVTLRNVKGS